MEIVVWIGLSVAVGFWADSKGRGGIVWGVISTLISPLLAAIILFFLLQKDQSQAEEKKRIEQAAEVDEKRKKEIAHQAKSQENTIDTLEFCKQIEKFFNLAENGLLTQDEFIGTKKELIATLIAKKLREPVADFLSGLIPLVKKGAITQEEISTIKKYVM